jgi:predicted RNA-binding protein YlqC (UPF0109 family)
MGDAAKIEQLVTYLATSLVDEPEKVSVARVEDGGAVVFEITVDPADIGKVVGKQGRIIKAIRTVARAAGQVEGTDVHVEVLG